MNRIGKIALVAILALPATALAGNVVGSKHDMSSGSGNSITTTNMDQVCKFCHIPHKARGQALIWNANAVPAVGFPDNTVTVQGTTLPTALQPASARCFSCHDGTAIAMYNLGHDPAPIWGPDGDQVEAANTFTIVAGDLVEPHHPVSVAYAGVAAYYTTASGVPASAADGDLGEYYAPIANASCTSPSGNCVNSADGYALNVYDDGTAGNYGIECNTCHDVHNNAVPAGADYFLRVTPMDSAICLSCHNK